MLWCNNNRIASLDVSKNVDLIHLDCSNNYIPKTEIPAIRDGVIVWKTEPQKDTTEDQIAE